MLQITPSFGKKYFFFPNGLNYLMMNSNAVEKKKKAGRTTSNLASTQGEAVGSSS